MEFKIDPEISALFEGLEEWTYEELKKDIAIRGILNPITISQEDMIIVKGHQRYAIGKELGIEWQLGINYIIKEYESREEMIEDAIKDNILRRHLNTYQKGLIAKKYLKRAKKYAKKTKNLAAELGRAKQEGNEGEIERLCNALHNRKKGKARDVAAETVGICGVTLDRVEYIEEHGTEEQKIQGRLGQKSVKQLFKVIKRDENIAELKEAAKNLPKIDGIYDVIVIDPPWPYDLSYDPDGRRGIIPYPPMSIEDLEQLELPTNDICVLWLWTTNQFLHTAFHLLEAWGFEYKTLLTWAKDKMGIGHWLRAQTEHCILAVKGKPVIDLTNQTTLLYAKRGEHSSKPNEFYELVESLCYGSKLDYFARETKEGWDCFGTLENE